MESPPIASAKVIELVAIPLLVGLAGTLLYLRFETALKHIAERKPSFITGMAGLLLVAAGAMIIIPAWNIRLRAAQPIFIQPVMPVWRAAVISIAVVLASLSELVNASISKPDARANAIASLVGPVRTCYIVGCSIAVYKIYGSGSFVLSRGFLFTISVVGLVIALPLAKGAAERWSDEDGRATTYAKQAVAACTAVSWASVLIILWL
jgi:hypothetical protein